MKIPITDIRKPLYNPIGPSAFKIYAQQSYNPLNYLSVADLPKSAPNLVLAKSRGYLYDNYYLQFLIKF